MSKYVKYYDLKPGDEIVTPKSAFNIIQHHALYIGYDETGTDWIIHNNAGAGVCLISVNDFFNQCQQVNKIVRFAGTNDDRRRLVQRSLRESGKPYNLIVYNCEHFTSEMKTGVKESLQVENAVLGLLLIAFMGVLFGD